jgi:hypothetical protein
LNGDVFIGYKREKRPELPKKCGGMVEHCQFGNRPRPRPSKIGGKIEDEDEDDYENKHEWQGCQSTNTTKARTLIRLRRTLKN